MQVIDVPNTLRLKVGGGDGPIEAEAISRAEAALAAMSDQFGEWMDREIDRLEAARQRLRAEGLTPGAMEDLQCSAHDSKGLGATYKFPLVSKLAGSLCRYLEILPEDKSPSLALIEGHVDAIRSIVRAGIRTEDHPLGIALLTELKAKVQALA